MSQPGSFPTEKVIGGYDFAGTLYVPGCSIAQLCPCDGPRGTTVGWKNHGKYVSCVAKSAGSFVDQGLLSAAEKDEIVSQAAESECGAK